MKAVHMRPENRLRQLEDGRMHLRFMVSIYWTQLKAGRHFLHEHPAQAASWKDPAIVELLADSRVDSVIGHQCQYGLATKR